MRKDARVWVRLGDNGDYESFDSAHEAGCHIGMFLSAYDTETKYRDKGVEVSSFVGYNYISLYWGDDDAQPVNDADLNTSERMDFEAGIQEGLDN